METQSAPSALTPAQLNVVQSGSWGAACFQWIYLLVMKSPKDALISFLVGFIPVANLVVWIYYITNGKKLAWANRTWLGFDDFLACQRIWDRWAKWLLAISLVFALLGITAAILLPLFLKGPRPTL